MKGLASALIVVAAVAVPAVPEVDRLQVPTFGEVVVYQPTGPAKQVVLFVSGDGGWNLGVVSMAERLRDRGALVVGIDIRTFMRSLERSKGCAYPAGALEELSRAVQVRYRLPAYKPPILVGYSSGATLVYAALVAAPAETFAGALSLGFCPDIDLSTPLCEIRGLKARKKTRDTGYDLFPFAGLHVPWMVLQGEIDQVCAPGSTRAFVTATGSARLFSLPGVGHGFAVPRNWGAQFDAAYQAIVDANAIREAPAISVPEVADLPLVEVPAREMMDRGDMAIIVSGDGGWAELDKRVADGLAGAGIPTVGFSSLRYFWTPRTPESAAADLSRVITHYSSAWHKDRVILIGYSFGADVLPYIVNRLTPTARVKVASVALLGLATTAAFEFHVAEWVGQSPGQSYPTLPEVERLSMPVTCVRGAGEGDSACLSARGPHVRTVTVGEGHHFSGDYTRLVDAILGAS